MSVDAFIPTLWSKKFLDRLKEEHVYAESVNRDYEGDIKNLGDTVRVNTVSPVTISSYTTNSINLTPEILHGTGQSMVIDQADYFYFAIDDVDKAQSQGGIMDQAMEDAAYEMADTTDSYLADLLVAGAGNVIPEAGTPSSPTNRITLAKTAPGDAYELLVDLSTELNQQNIPGNRWVVVDPNFVARLLLDDRFASFATAFAERTLKEGSSAGPEGGNLASTLKMLTGFSIKVSNSVPSDGTYFAIVAGYKGAASYAEQIAEGSPEAFRLQTGFADAVRGLHLYGGKVFRSSGLVKAYVEYT